MRPAWEADPKLRRKIGRRALVVKLVAALLFPTWRLSIQSTEAALRLCDEHGGICALWHSKQLPIFYAFRHHNVATMVSRSADGQMISGLLVKLGYRAIRGSSSRGALSAFRELIRNIGPKQVVAVTVDGPRGPAHEVKPGVLQMARLSGAPIVPISAAVRRAWIFKRSWDRFCLPKPFTPGLVVLGVPVYVPPDADDVRIKQIHQELQQQMIALEQGTEDHKHTAQQRREWVETCDRRFREAIADHVRTHNL